MGKLIGEAGRPYGHVPGHQYLDVEVYRRAKCHDYLLRIVWGSNQGRDAEHGRLEAARETFDALRDAGIALADHEMSERASDETRGYVETAIARAKSKVRGRGRPRAEREARDGQLPRVRVTAALDSAVRERAEGEGIEVSELVRRALVQYLEA